MDIRHFAQEVDTNQTAAKPDESNPKAKQRARSRKTEGSSATDESVKRRCVSTACIGMKRMYLLAYTCSDMHQLVGDVNQSVSVRYNPLSNHTANS
jgi:hypothetical protein